MKTWKNMFFITAILAIMIFGGIAVTQGQTQLTATSNVISGNAQIIKMYVENGKYILNPQEVKRGVPVRIEADISRMPGCSKSIVIPAFGVQKVVTESDNTIDFTPNKAGTFNIACSMNMYRGTFTVLESDGSKSGYVDQTAPKGGSCGASGGGCGCGGIR